MSSFRSWRSDKNRPRAELQTTGWGREFQQPGQRRNAAGRRHVWSEGGAESKNPQGWQQNQAETGRRGENWGEAGRSGENWGEEGRNGEKRGETG